LGGPICYGFFFFKMGGGGGGGYSVNQPLKKLEEYARHVVCVSGHYVYRLG
jgi:hypothetical protein